MSRRIIKILDTTLRDGLQSPYLSLEDKSKKKVALALEKLGVEHIEIGFPASSKEEFEFIKKMSTEIKKAKICVIARLVDNDIDKAIQATKNAKNKRITLMIPTNKFLKLNKQELFRSINNSYSTAEKGFTDIAFAIQDTTRINKKFLFQIVEFILGLGTKTIVLADTVGSATPAEYGLLFKEIKERFNGNFVLAAHCHNDLGLAAANALAAIENGAEQIDCSIGGIGERAGNTSLEEIVSIIKFKKSKNFYTKVNTELIYETCTLFSKELKECVFQKNKTIFGEMIFTHKSGIHQNGVLENPFMFELLDPSKIGYPGRSFVIGKSSGIAGLKYLIKTKKIKTRKNETPEQILSDVKTGVRNFNNKAFPI